jgi:type IV pilus assembly protein PilC
LQDNLKHLVVQMQKEYDLRRKIRGAMMYPLFIIGAAIALSIGIVVFILPNIKEVFAALQVDLPLPTRILLWVADTVTEHGVMTVLSALGVCVFFLILRKIPIVQPYLHRALMATPFLGSMSRRINVGRFSRLMGTMLQGGMPINQIFPVVRSVLKNKQYTLMFEEMESEVGHGESVSGVLKSYLFLVPPITLRMIHVGEQTGSLPEMLLYLADFYEREIDEITKNLATLLEPALLIFVGLLVGGLAISIMMPIYQVVGQF